MEEVRAIFVFGSNLAGIHGGGAARNAYDERGAVWGVGVGPQGDCYAIPTKDQQIETLPLQIVRLYVLQFLAYARTLNEAGDTRVFHVTRIGCGLAGFKDEEIAPLFMYAPKNCHFDKMWAEWLSKDVEFWGTF